MTGQDGMLGLTAAAEEHLHTARLHVARLLDDVDGVAAGLRVAADIPWSGRAATVWRERLDDVRHGLLEGAHGLAGLDDDLGAILRRIRT